MNYRKHYDALIERAKCRVLTGYTERHHVLPRCMGGGDEPENVVVLTAEEHFVAHQLLVKLYPNVVELVLAANIMTASPTRRRNNNRQYGWLKRQLAVVTSKRFLGRSWSDEQNASRSLTVKELWKNPEFRARATSGMRGKPWSEERRAAKSAAMRGKPGRAWTAEQRAKLSEVKRQQHLLKGAVKS